jgi:hypothetical protein
MKLYDPLNLNSRVAVAVARHLRSSVDYVLAVRRMAARPCRVALALTLACGAPVAAEAQALQGGYPHSAPLDQYHMANQADEITLARSAAPRSISGQAEVMTLDARGYKTAVKGNNGFVCLVQRGWNGDFKDADFWNPKVLAPICYNSIAARSVMPNDLKRAQWALAGLAKADMISRTQAAIATHVFVGPDVGAMSYMMSRNGHLNDRFGHWVPHLMFFLPRMQPSNWGANTPGGVVMGDASSLEPITVFFVPLAAWSDGTPATGHM